jgi:hypothetical protein
VITDTQLCLVASFQANVFHLLIATQSQHSQVTTERRRFVQRSTSNVQCSITAAAMQGVAKRKMQVLRVERVDMNTALCRFCNQYRRSGTIVVTRPSLSQYGVRRVSDRVESINGSTHIQLT